VTTQYTAYMLFQDVEQIT